MYNLVYACVCVCVVVFLTRLSLSARCVRAGDTSPGWCLSPNPVNTSPTVRACVRAVQRSHLYHVLLVYYMSCMYSYHVLLVYCMYLYCALESSCGVVQRTLRRRRSGRKLWSSSATWCPTSSTACWWTRCQATPSPPPAWPPPTYWRPRSRPSWRPRPPPSVQWSELRSLVGGRRPEPPEPRPLYLFKSSLKALYIICLKAL